MNNFCTFILSYGRADNVKTYYTLKKQNYTGDIKIVCSTDDKELYKYKENFQDEVVVFDKKKVKYFDIGDNYDNEKVVVYARNEVFKIAKDLNYKYFLVLDDDYTGFRFKVNEKGKYITRKSLIKNVSNIIEILLKYFRSTNLKTLAIAQGGDFIGGSSCHVFKNGITRKAMNFFICSTERPFTFLGRVNEDVTTYVKQGEVGDLFFTICEIGLEQTPTQQNKGGLTDIYLDQGTYLKSFYSVIYSPSCVKVSMMGLNFRRLHHRVSWNNAAPKILNINYKK